MQSQKGDTQGADALVDGSGMEGTARRVARRAVGTGMKSKVGDEEGDEGRTKGEGRRTKDKTTGVAEQTKGRLA